MKRRGLMATASRDTWRKSPGARGPWKRGRRGLQGPRRKRKKAAPVEVSKRERNERVKPASSKEKKESGKKPRQRIVMFDSDSDEEEPIPKKAKKQAKECKAAAVDSDEDSEEPIVSKKPAERTQAAISKERTFEERPQSNPASKLSLKASQAKKVSTAKESHEDDDFQKTLAKLDEKTEEKKLTTRSSPRKTSKDSESSVVKKSSPSKGSATEKPESSKKLEKEKAATKHSPKKRKAESPVARASDSASQSSKKAEKEPTHKRESPRKVPEKTERVTPGKQAARKEKPAPAKEKVPKEEKPAAAAAPAFRRGNAANYQSYLNREGPRLLGTRDIPEGAPGCLKGVTLVVTGVLECIERDDAKELLERCGAKVTQSVSRNTTYLVAGRDSGPAKIRKAEECKVEIIDEDALYELIESRSGGDGKRKAEDAEVKKKPEEASTPKKKRKVDPDDSSEESRSKSSPRVKEHVISPTKKSKDASTTETPSTSSSQQSRTTAEMWVDKYKPQTTKQIIGQQGDKSNCGKLLLWLRNWHKSRLGPKKPIPKWGGGGGDGSAFKAALLSGAPGIGKTTTATLAAREAGYSILEMNASDTRSKKSLAEHVAETLKNRTFTESGTTSKHVLIMDEVDGMAGNEDRAAASQANSGCIDVHRMQGRSLHHTPAVVQEIVMASNQDVRQALHNLSLWSSRTKTMSVSQVKADAGKGTKDIKMGPFDVVRKILSSTEGGQSMTLNEKAALFFHDYNMVPLFVQDNYLHVQPLEAKGDRQKHLRLVSEAADCISYGDLVERQIRQHGSWSLLPMQAFFSSVIPGELVRGHMREMISFPAWFGKNSSTTKRHRLLRELKHHTHTRVSADRTQLSMDYVGPLLDSLTKPLIDKGADGVPSVVSRMHHYYLQRADLDNLCDLALWPGMKDPMANIDSKVKAALTRTLNKEAFMTPYSTGDFVKKKAKKGAGKSEKLAASQDDEENAEEEEEDEEPDPTLVDYE
ncbi:hypothetical protein MRX96_015717 [Rhipicephalus microplus]